MSESWPPSTAPSYSADPGTHHDDGRAGGEQDRDGDVDRVLDEHERPVAQAHVRRRPFAGLGHPAIMPISSG